MPRLFSPAYAIVISFGLVAILAEKMQNIVEKTVLSLFIKFRFHIYCGLAYTGSELAVSLLQKMANNE